LNTNKTFVKVLNFDKGRSNDSLCGTSPEASESLGLTKQARN